MSETHGVSFDNVVNPCISLFARFLDTEHFGLQTDLIYLRKGASQTFEVPEDLWDITREREYTTEFGFQYLTLALAAQPRVSFEDVAVYAHIGPTANYMLTAHNFGSLEEFKRFQVGYTVGLGFDFAHIFNSHIFVEVQYTGDFQPFYEDSFEKDYHRLWMLCLGPHCRCSVLGQVGAATQRRLTGGHPTLVHLYRLLRFKVWREILNSLHGAALPGSRFASFIRIERVHCDKSGRATAGARQTLGAIAVRPQVHHVQTWRSNEGSEVVCVDEAVRSSYRAVAQAQLVSSVGVKAGVARQQYSTDGCQPSESGWPILLHP